MTPWALEGAVQPDRGVRECPLCAPWIECAHFGDEVVQLARTAISKQWCIHGPGVPLASDSQRWACHASNDEDCFVYMQRIDAYAEFERRVALMLEAE